ncbi:MAG: LysR family transcriptional regulator [Pseudomonadota bacterium]
MHATGKPLTRQIDLNLLELFDTVYRLRNLTAAGERLGLSQSAVSYSVGRLRRIYGDSLFVRMPRGVQPTPFAEGLAGPVAQALEIVRATMSVTEFVPQRDSRTFRIAMNDVGECMMLPHVIAWLRAEAPFISLETLSPTLDELGSGLASGEIDAAIGFVDGLGKQVHQKTLFTENFVYILRADHPRKSKSMTTAQARRLVHVIASPQGMDHASSVEKVLRRKPMQARVALRVTSFLSLLPIVASSDLVAPIPENLANYARRDGKVRICAPPVRFPTFDVCMYWHQRFHQDPANVWLRDGLLRLFAGGQVFR